MRWFERWPFIITVLLLTFAGLGLLIRHSYHQSPAVLPPPSGPSPTEPLPIITSSPPAPLAPELDPGAMPLAVTQSIANTMNRFWPEVGYSGIRYTGVDTGLVINMSLGYCSADARAASESAVEILGGYRPHEHWWACVRMPGFHDPVYMSHYDPIGGKITSTISEEFHRAIYLAP